MHNGNKDDPGPILFRRTTGRNPLYNELVTYKDFNAQLSDNLRSTRCPGENSVNPGVSRKVASRCHHLIV